MQMRMGIALFAMAATWQSAVVGQERSLPIVRVICLPARPLAVVVASERHLFEKHGVRVDAEVAPNSDALRAGLSDGKYDVAHAAVDNAVALAEKSRQEIIVVVGGEGSTNELIAQPGTKAVSELKGKTLIVDAPTTAYAIQLKAILLRNGLHEGTDYTLKAVGGTPARLAAMRENKEYASSILGPPASLVAKHEGFVSLGTTQNLLGAYQGPGGFAQRAWATAHRKELEGYIAAFVEAQRWLMDPANKAEVLALLKREYKLSDDLAAETYATWIVGPGGLQKDARVSLEGFENVLNLREQTEHTWPGTIPPVQQFYDGSFYESAIGSGNR